MAVAVTTAAAIYPVSVLDVRNHCRIDTADNDDYLLGLIASALSTLRTLPGAHDRHSLRLPHGQVADSAVIELPRNPVSAVGSVQYYDSANVLQTITSTNYVTDFVSIPARISEAPGYSWPNHYTRTNACLVNFTRGTYGDDQRAPGAGPGGQDAGGALVREPRAGEHRQHHHAAAVDARQPHLAVADTQAT